MSKLVLFLAVPAVAGLAAWNLSLSSELDDLRRQVAAQESAPAPEVLKAAEAAKAPAVSRLVQQEVSGLASRLAEVEKRLPPAPAEGAALPAASAPPPGATSSPEVLGAFGSDAFKGAVARVLEEREEARRRERADRQAESVTRFLLRDLTVTDPQRSEVKRLVAQSMEKVEKIREDETLTDEQRREQVQAAQQARIESLTTVLDEKQMETVRQRSQQNRARPNGLRGPGGGGRQGRPAEGAR